MSENDDTEEGMIGTIDGCSIDFTPASDEETQALLIPKGKEFQEWSEEEEQEKIHGT